MGNLPQAAISRRQYAFPESVKGWALPGRRLSCQGDGRTTDVLNNAYPSLCVFLPCLSWMRMHLGTPGRASVLLLNYDDLCSQCLTFNIR